jgi:hypothetical protein
VLKPVYSLISASSRSISSVSLLSNNTVLKMDFQNILPSHVSDGNNIFTIDDDYYFVSEITETLGLKSIYVKAGVYEVDFSENKFGTLYLNIVAN